MALVGADMNKSQLFGVAALLCAVLSVVTAGYPWLTIAVVLLALALLL